MLQWFQDAILEVMTRMERHRRNYRSAVVSGLSNAKNKRLILRNVGILSTQRIAEASGTFGTIRVQVVENWGEMEETLGLGDMFGMGSMKGTSEGDWIHIILCVVAQFGTLHSIHMHIDFELFAAFHIPGLQRRSKEATIRPGIRCQNP